MQAITKSIDDWVLFFTELDLIKKKKGSQELFLFLGALEAMEQRKLPDMKKYADYFDLFYRFSITDIYAIKAFINEVGSYYRYDKVILDIEKMKLEYGIEKIGFLLEPDTGYLVDTYNNIGGFQKVYLPNNIHPFVTLDFKSNGVDTCSVFSGIDFIVDKLDQDYHLKSRKERTLYTKKFLYQATFPSKEQMDCYRLEEERRNTFYFLLNSLEPYFEENKVHLIVDNPNVVYKQLNSFDKYHAIRTDGLVFSDVNELVLPSKRNYLRGENKVLVKNAKIVVISEVIEDNVENIYVICEQDFLLEYFKNIYSNTGDIQYRSSLEKLARTLNNKKFKDFMVK